ncbi:TMEM143 family protein [Haloechinothrix salitolerans]|uniref:TMEM143 family protein n=1 Tax=Haloechinothrix salitolerans TaxID=926830 RepID=A0ABW2BX54_9PSEU
MSDCRAKGPTVTGEYFIPFRKRSVITLCADELAEDDRKPFLAFTEILASLLHHRFRARIEELKDAYHAFAPDVDARTSEPVTTAERAEAKRKLVDGLRALAEDANFTLVGADEFGRAISDHSLLKVRMEVDHDAIDDVLIYRRGATDRTAKVPHWFGLRRKTVEFVSYDKVLLYVAFPENVDEEKRDELPFEPGAVMLKLFQDVPRRDLEMLLPNVGVRMRPIDKLLIGVPAVVSGIVVVVTKLIASLGVLFLLLAFWLGLRDQPVDLDQAALISLGAGLAAFGGYLWRQFTKFKNRKIKFMKVLSESLYFRNLDNDAGVFHHILDAAEESKVKEAVIAYHLLRLSDAPLTVDELGARADRWLERRSGVPVRFDVDDGLRTLRRLKLLIDHDDESVSVVSLPEAKRRIDHIWDNVFSYNDELADIASSSGR